MKCSSCEAEQQMQKKKKKKVKFSRPCLPFLLKQVFLFQQQMIFRQTEIKPLWYFWLSAEWYRCQLRQPGVCGSLNQGPGTTWWCIHKAADKQRAMARQGHVFCPEIGHLCLFAQRGKKNPILEMVSGCTDCLSHLGDRGSEQSGAVHSILLWY